MKIMPNRMDRTYYKYQQELEAKALEVLRSGWYVLGNEVSLFEQEFAAYLGSKHCVGLANGLDALWIAFRVLNIGAHDEVIVQANTYIASVMGITINGATPVFVEPDSYYEIDTTKAVFGDFNSDGKIDVNDATILQMFILGRHKLSDLKVLSADLDGDGLIMITDVTYLQMKIAESADSM